MKSAIHSIAMLALIICFAACGGSGGSSGAGAARDLEASPGDNTNRPTMPDPASCGGIAGTPCPEGQVCVDVTDSCDPATGADCAGHCEPDASGRCTSDADCASIQQCSTCPDGQQLCTTASCSDGACVAPVLDCPQPPPVGCGALTGAACPPGYTCVDDPSDMCDGGPAVDCPALCEPSNSGTCDDDADCPAIRAPCTVCADGSASCPRSYCANGQCTVEMNACPRPNTCGGIAGTPCPPGFVCLDAPMDACDPTVGADCGGICVADQRPPTCNGVSGAVCPDGYECIDDAADECAPANGADCPGVCQPNLPPKCSADADCPQLHMRCGFCADGTEVCSTSTCAAGLCQVNYPSCPTPSGCDVEPCKPGYVCVALPVPMCDPATGVACGSSSTCIPDDGARQCGGFAGDTCPPGFRCADQPMDECDPQNGGADCPGICEPDRGSQCNTDADCPHVLAPCSLCEDGTYACPHSFCTNGMCGVSIDACSEPKFCGGIAGFPCPPDKVCIDDPQDDCSPERGGADCGGICVNKPEM